MKKLLIICCIAIFQFGCKNQHPNQQPNTSLNTQELELDFKIRDTLLNTNEFLVIGPKNGHIQLTDSISVARDSSLHTLAKYKHHFIVSKNLKYADVLLYKKYTFIPSFKDYSVGMYTKKLALPNFSTYPKAKLFKTRIEDACKDGVNFAGHFTLVSIGCGSACQAHYIVNRKSGRITPIFVSSLGVSYEKDSKLIIKNAGAIDNSTNLIELCPYCEVSHYTWEENTLKPLD